jgi:hypothetical protein
MAKKASIPPIVDAPLPPPAPLPDERNLVMCDADRRPIVRVKGDPRFRLTFQGRTFEHVGQDAEGRWLYAPLP